jgi:hypothetical protein
MLNRGVAILEGLFLGTLDGYLWLSTPRAAGCLKTQVGLHQAYAWYTRAVKDALIGRIWHPRFHRRVRCEERKGSLAI